VPKSTVGCCHVKQNHVNSSIILILPTVRSTYLLKQLQVQDCNRIRVGRHQILMFLLWIGGPIVLKGNASL